MDHVYAILRYDADVGPGEPIDQRVTVKRIVWNFEDAVKEVQRLNELNKEKGAYYFYQVTRLEKQPVPVQDGLPVAMGVREGP